MNKKNTATIIKTNIKINKNKNLKIYYFKIKLIIFSNKNEFK